MIYHQNPSAAPAFARAFTVLIRRGTLGFLCLGLLMAGSVAKAASADYNVRDFGAAGDGQQLDSPAIDRAIEAAVAAGGGRVVVPAGTYLCGSIHLRSNLQLELAAGAVILGAPQKLNAYDETEPYTLGGYQDGGHCYFHNSLLWGEGLTNVTITGHGMINGGGLARDSKLLDKMCGFDHWQHPTTNSLPSVRLGNKAIALKLCRNVVIRDITIYHGGHFAILVTGCDNLTVDNVTIDTNRDGIDIDCCRSTTISNCRINSPNDDGLCPKSTHALGETRLTEDLTIVNCQVSGFKEGTLIDGTRVTRHGGYGRIKFGTEASGGFRNCTIANCTFHSCRGLALEEVDGGILENITINNLAMEDVQTYAIYLTTGCRQRTPGVTTASRMRHIFISNVVADGVDAMSGIQIMGQTNEPITGVRLENIRLISRGGGTRADAALKPAELGDGYPEPERLGRLPAWGVYARHVRDLELANIHLELQTNDYRPALQFVDVQDLTLDNVQPTSVPKVIPATFSKNTQEVHIRNSPLLWRR